MIGGAPGGTRWLMPSSFTWPRTRFRPRLEIQSSKTTGHRERDELFSTENQKPPRARLAACCNAHTHRWDSVGVSPHCDSQRGRWQLSPVARATLPGKGDVAADNCETAIVIGSRGETLGPEVGGMELSTSTRGKYGRTQVSRGRRRRRVFSKPPTASCAVGGHDPRRHGLRCGSRSRAASRLECSLPRPSAAGWFRA